MFYQNPQGEIFKVWMVFIFHDNDVWQLKWCMTVESLSHTQRGYWFYSLMIFICFIKIHKVNSSKYEWSLDLLTVIIDSWIFTTNTEWTKTLKWIFMCFIEIHKVKSSKYECSLDLLTVIFDSWISVTNKKGTQRFYSWKVFICFFKNLPGEILELWKVFKYVGSDIWQMNIHRFYSLMIFMCFVKIHKVNSSKYEWSLDLLTVIFDSWIFITNKKGTLLILINNFWKFIHKCNILSLLCSGETALNFKDIYEHP